MVKLEKMIIIVHREPNVHVCDGTASEENLINIKKFKAG